MDSPFRQSGVQMLQKGNTLSFLSRRSTAPRPLSEATEIFDTDFEEDFSDADNTPRSFGSFGDDSQTTVSTLDELRTPNSSGLGGFDFHFDDKPVQGPTGPHLFRMSSESNPGVHGELDLYLDSSPIPEVKPLNIPTRTFTAIHDVPLSPSRPFSSLNKAVAELDDVQVRTWSPRQVADWMFSAGFESIIVDKFLLNDISGIVLLDLQFEDLKELDIQSFGQRHRLINSIQHLRNSSMISTTPPTRNASINTSPVSLEEQQQSSESSPRPRRRHRKHRKDDTISPAESVSIVAIEQLLPKPHTCSKGEDCAKWQKQQRKLARLAEEFPIEPQRGGSTFIAGNPGSPATAENVLTRPTSDAGPSVVASSDVLGPTQIPEFHLSPEALNEVRPRDPQENVRQFLSFQHMQAPVEEPMQLFPPIPAKEVIPLAEHLRNLPKLSIPFDAAADVASNRTITPSFGLRKIKTPISAPRDPASAVNCMANSPYYYGAITSPADVYRQTSPFSEMDIPLTAIPMGPIARETSQSVPPEMRYGDYPHSAAPALRHTSTDPVRRSASTRPEQPPFRSNSHHRRNASFGTTSNKPMAPLAEGRPFNPITPPIEIEDLDPTPRATGATLDPTIAHHGWMKKRKTTRLLRHEWTDAHFTLRGTRLAMHKDDSHITSVSHRSSKALEYIDVDDYAVACSSLASSSKLSAAFKKSILGSSSSSSAKGLDDSAFAFSLIPAAEKRQFLAGAKAHHFAVKNRDDRIDWMRELMLAKALKKGKMMGDEVRVNGNVI